MLNRAYRWRMGDFPENVQDITGDKEFHSCDKLLKYIVLDHTNMKATY